MSTAAAKVKERPILFSSAMVRAILEDRKVQHRTEVRLLPSWTDQGLTHDDLIESGWWVSPEGWQYGDEIVPCPYSKPGDRLLVLELREIPGVPPLYAAGSDGRIYSYSTARTNSKKDIPFPLSICRRGDGYPVVTIAGKPNKNASIHTLVCAAFHGPKPFSDAIVRHLDGNRKNNDPANLMWGTYAENEADKRRHKTLACGERQGSAKLTAEDVRIIRETVSIGLVTSERASQFYGVYPQTINSIMRGDDWRGMGDSPAPAPSYSHLRLLITGIHVERLQEISEEDAKAEGVEYHIGVERWRTYSLKGQTPFCSPTAKDSFFSLWDSINAKRDGGKHAWSSNPWVWAIEFKRVQP